MLTAEESEIKYPPWLLNCDNLQIIEDYIIQYFQELYSKNHQLGAGSLNGRVNP